MMSDRKPFNVAVDEQSVLEFNSERDVILPGSRMERSQRDGHLQGDSTLGKSITKKDDSFDTCSDLSIVFDNIDGMRERHNYLNTYSQNNDLEFRSQDTMVDIQN